LLACGCAQPGLFTVFDDATASLGTNPDSLSPRDRTDVLFGHDRIKRFVKVIRREKGEKQLSESIVGIWANG
jgi:hypothetical protein